MYKFIARMHTPSLLIVAGILISTSHPQLFHYVSCVYLLYKISTVLNRFTLRRHFVSEDDYFETMYTLTIILTKCSVISVSYLTLNEY